MTEQEARDYWRNKHSKEYIALLDKKAEWTPRDMRRAKYLYTMLKA